MGVALLQCALRCSLGTRLSCLLQQPLLLLRPSPLPAQLCTGGAPCLRPVPAMVHSRVPRSPVLEPPGRAAAADRPLEPLAPPSLGLCPGASGWLRLPSLLGLQVKGYPSASDLGSQGKGVCFQSASGAVPLRHPGPHLSLHSACLSTEYVCTAIHSNFNFSLSYLRV